MEVLIKNFRRTQKFTRNEGFLSPVEMNFNCLLATLTGREHFYPKFQTCRNRYSPQGGNWSDQKWNVPGEKCWWGGEGERLE